ncbi:unnamed protein product [Durusdinium trenchii]|uniref:Uncharacterized protein n=2 Tax=Durusdinium trenchii TaxID=1381693 RepID=A0ABP0NG56_9DINO
MLAGSAVILERVWGIPQHASAKLNLQRIPSSTSVLECFCKVAEHMQQNINDEAFDRVLSQMSCHDIKQILLALKLLSQELEVERMRAMRISIVPQTHSGDHFVKSKSPKSADGQSPVSSVPDPQEGVPEGNHARGGVQDGTEEAPVQLVQHDALADVQEEDVKVAVDERHAPDDPPEGMPVVSMAC